MKVFLGEDYKKAQGITPDFLARHIPTWHQELETMAMHGVMPHLIVALGTQVWDPAWRSLHPEAEFAPEHFSVESYQTCGDPCFHHANLITVNVGGRKQPILLVRMTHPAAQGNRRAGWLLGQEAFRELARMR